MKSNLPEDLKFELIALIQNPPTPTVIQYPVSIEKPMRMDWWDTVTVYAGEDPDWSGKRRAAADSVVPAKTWYSCTKAVI